MDTFLIIALVYLVIGAIIVYTTTQISPDYVDRVNGDIVQYARDIVMWLPDLVEFIFEDER